MHMIPRHEVQKEQTAFMQPRRLLHQETQMEDLSHPHAPQHVLPRHSFQPPLTSNCQEKCLSFGKGQPGAWAPFHRGVDLVQRAFWEQQVSLGVSTQPESRDLSALLPQHRLRASLLEAKNVLMIN